MSTFDIRRLDRSDVEDYRVIRLAGLQQAPEAFGSTYEAEVAWPLADFERRLTDAAVFGASAAGSLVGVAGFKQEGGRKHTHKGFVFGMFVRPEARGEGVGAALLDVMFRSARESVEQLTLTVAKGNDGAIALYEKAGFVTYGVEPRSLRTATGYCDEILMVRFLRP